MTDVDVLVVGAGPVGLTAALELRRRGIECRVVDRLPSPAMVAKAVGIQPRTLEIWQAAGLAQDALDAATQLHGQKVFVNGEQTAELTLTPSAVGAIRVRRAAAVRGIREQPGRSRDGDHA
jgi:2-polyprenyl-6-methoxyphenol hydroxylase-like FAD-dependent oxidoreductase